jgi:hypothetical protein
VAAHEEEAARHPGLGGPGQVDHLGNVCQVVEAEPDGIRLPGFQEPEIVLVTEDLQVEDADVVAGPAGGRRHEFDAQGFEPEIDLRVHETAGVAAEDLHGCLPSLVVERRGGGRRPPLLEPIIAREAVARNRQAPHPTKLPWAVIVKFGTMRPISAADSAKAR